MSSVRIGPRPPKIQAESQQQRLGARILYDFAFSEFTRPIGSDSVFQYKASCAIARRVLRNSNKDSILYPSMLDFRRVNIALRPDAAEERAIPRVALVCTLDSPPDSDVPAVSAEAVGCSCGGSNAIDYHDMSPGLITSTDDLGLNAIMSLLEGEDPWESIERAIAVATQEFPYETFCKPPS